ncbi:restriction endonuclease subunit S [Sporofaciens musculi]|uniref:restriction endonuclease subunit S n=1 Tax=Sporofaciens musculi TaxID=2681861 RepID=UPI0025A2895E|nr:restriction endonuclease subunit S [Sporofaciens musculi]
MGDKCVPKVRFREFSEEWERRRLKEIVDLCSGKDYKHLSEGNIPVYGTGGYMLSVDKALSYERDAIGIGRKGTIDKPFILRAPFWTVDTLFYAVPSDYENIDFLYDIFQKIDWRKRDESTGVPSLSKEAINEIEVIIPLSREQKKIGSYFKQLDDLITLYQCKCEKLKLLKEAMLDKMFPKNGQKIPEIRFRGFSGEWECRKLGEVVEFLDTRRKPLEGAKRVNGSYPYYGASGIVDYVEGYLFDEELILLSEDGANITDRNYPICFLASGKYWVNNHAHVLKTKQGNENNFICNSLERKDYSQYNTGMAMPKLNQEVCRNIPISCPSYEEQKEIGDYFRSIDFLIILNQHKYEKLELLKKAMLDKMFILERIEI